MDIAVQAERMIQMRDGLIQEDTAIDDRRREEIMGLTQEAHTRAFRHKMSIKTGSTAADAAQRI